MALDNESEILEKSVETLFKLKSVLSILPLLLDKIELALSTTELNPSIDLLKLEILSLYETIS